MAKFDAATSVEAMDVDFSKYGGPVGTIPEPSKGQVEKFFSNIKDLNIYASKIIEGAEKLSREEEQEKLREYAESIPEEEIKARSEEIYGWVEDVTNGFLPAAQMREIPYRVFTAFFRWLAGELNPKEPTD